MVRERWLRRALLGAGFLGCLVGSGVAQDNQRSPWTVRLDHLCTESPEGTGRPQWNQTKVAPWSGRSDMGAVVSDGGTLFVYGGQGGAALLRVSASPKPRLTAHSPPSISYRSASRCSRCVRERILPPSELSARWQDVWSTSNGEDWTVVGLRASREHSPRSPPAWDRVPP